MWDSSYVSTGVYDENVNKVLGEANRAGDTDNSSDLGNGEVSYGYAVKGVEFTYLRVGNIVQYTESTNDGAAQNHAEVLYGIDKTVGAGLLTALGLENGTKRYTNADHLDSGKYYYQSDVLIDALALALQNNSTTVKNALETYVVSNGGTAMPLTDSYGKSQAANLASISLPKPSAPKWSPPPVPLSSSASQRAPFPAPTPPMAAPVGSMM